MGFPPALSTRIGRAPIAGSFETEVMSFECNSSKNALYRRRDIYGNVRKIKKEST